MAKKKPKPTRAAGARAAMAGLFPLSLIASPQARVNEIKPTPMVVPKRKGKGK